MRSVVRPRGSKCHPIRAAFAVVAGGAGVVVPHLVRQMRAHASIALKRQRDLEILLEATREIAKAANVREAVCEAACLLTGGPSCVLLEFDDDGCLMTRASAGALSRDLAAASAGRLVTTALARGKGVVAAAAADRSDGWLLSALGDPRFVAIEPVIGPKLTAVLAIGWQQAPGNRPETLPLLAAEAATAIARADFMAELEGLARIDPLTKLPNRRAWDEELSRVLHSTQRAGRPLTVALLDLDRFKAYNDTYGHQAGDRLLQQLTVTWRGELRESDLIARWGGDEFALLLQDQTLPEARQAVRRLLDSTPDQPLSAGVAEWDGSEDGDMLLARADRELYASKAATRHGLNEPHQDAGT